MNTDKFTEQLQQLSDDDWQLLADGKMLYMKNDLSLVIDDAGSALAILEALLQQDFTAAALKQAVLDEAAEILQDYYRENFMTRIGFNAQLSRLIDEHGAAQFAAYGGEMPAMTVFVDGGEVVAETDASPRYRYGAYCEVESLKFADNLVKTWLDSGEAYQTYLSMNVCRNNC